MMESKLKCHLLEGRLREKGKKFVGDLTKSLVHAKTKYKILNFHNNNTYNIYHQLRMIDVLFTINTVVIFKITVCLLF